MSISILRGKPLKFSSTDFKKINDATMKALNEIENFNKTTTEELFIIGGKQELYNECKAIIIDRYNSNIMGNLTPEEGKCFEDAINYVHSLFPKRVLMAKVIPQCEIKKYLDFNYGIYSYMLRKADFFDIINKSTDFSKSKYDMLYDSLVLGYPSSKFNIDDKYVGVLFVELPEFANRNPVSLKNASFIKSNSNLIIKDNNSHYTGVGFTANNNGVMEFFVSISDKKSKINTIVNGEECSFDIGEGQFPIEAFQTNIFLINKQTDELFEFVSYDNSVNMEENNEEDYLRYKFQYTNNSSDIIKAKYAAKELNVEHFIE